MGRKEIFAKLAVRLCKLHRSNLVSACLWGRQNLPADFGLRPRTPCFGIVRFTSLRCALGQKIISANYELASGWVYYSSLRCNSQFSSKGRSNPPLSGVANFGLLDYGSAKLGRLVYTLGQKEISATIMYTSVRRGLHKSSEACFGGLIFGADESLLK